MHTISAETCSESKPLRRVERRRRSRSREAVDSTREVVVRKRVYDPVLRIIHAWNALVVIGLLASAELAQQWFSAAATETMWRLHVWLGIGLILGVVARLTWGLTGPAHARWRDLWHPGAWGRALRTRRWFTSPDRFGHHPEAALAYLGLYAALLLTIASGLVLAVFEQNMGPLVAWLDSGVQYLTVAGGVHEQLEIVIVLFLAAHLGALLLHRLYHRVPVAQSMVTGYQYLRRKS